MSGELPAGWCHFTLNDLGGLSGGKTPSKANAEFWSSRDVPWVSPKDMKKSLLEDAEDRISQIAVDVAGMTLYPAGSVLMVTRSGILQHTFPVALAGAELTVNQDIKVLRPIEGIAPKFSFYMLKSFGGEILSACSKDGTTVQSIDSEKLEAFPFPLPPLAEQTRIAAKLDELLAQVDTLKARIDGIPALLKRFRQSVLAAAVSGQLTEAWRDTHGVQLAEKKSIEDLSELVTKGASPKWQGISYVDDLSQTLFVTSENVRSMHLDLAQEKYVEDGFNSLQGRSVLQFGDVLTNIVGASIGRAAVWRHDRKANINQAVCIIRPRKEALISEYLSFYLNSPEGVANLAGEAVDVARANVSLSAVKGLKILAPGIPEQTEIVHRVEQLFAFADQLEAKVKDAKTRIDRLTQSILAKAFRGELVPQDPNDEPASELLARIQAQRASAPKARRGRKQAENT